ncbi:Oligosaccharide repeat unit polymerase Wzy; O-antigen ligase [hydrothermal vent metagenome]|uniref:Oligosaccharide repeat unit polymerase Wzy O-antigen ligase n=1 Tax=hydrothermal vent metagenome TaxID=652676 RepID=A0A3B1BQR9_9ZZZZ
MWLMSNVEYAALTTGASVLMRDGFGLKVLQCQGNRIVKLFRTKRLLSTSVVYPYSLRFTRNAKRLNRMGVPSVEVERTFYCHAIRRHGVIYPMLEGEALVAILANGEANDDLMEKLAGFIAQLHKQKIYFRSLHLGNVLLLPDGRLGLIDVADLSFNWLPLSMWQRRRNFRHLLRVSQHRQLIERFGIERFIECYLDAAGISCGEKSRFLSRLVTAPT